MPCLSRLLHKLPTRNGRVLARRINSIRMYHYLLALRDLHTDVRGNTCVPLLVF